MENGNSIDTVAGARHAVRPQPLQGQDLQSLDLGRRNRLKRMPVVRTSPRFDLRNDNCCPFQSNDVELPRAGTPIAVHDPLPGPFQIPGSQVFAVFAQFVFGSHTPSVAARMAMAQGAWHLCGRCSGP